VNSYTITSAPFLVSLERAGEGHNSQTAVLFMWASQQTVRPVKR